MRYPLLNSSIYKRALIVLFISSLAVIQQGRAQSSPQLIFDQANDQFQKGSYQEALSTYRSLEKRNQISGALFLNMGISYVQIDSLGKAKFYFLKASGFEETESQAYKALEYVESRFSRQSAVLPKLPWERAVD